MLTALFALCAFGAASLAPMRIHALALLIAPDRPREIETPPAPTAAVPDIPPERSAIARDDAGPTLARPAPGATGLFQGWGPRIGG